MKAERTAQGADQLLEAGYKVLGNPPSVRPCSCPAGPMPGQAADERILESHFFPGLIFEFQGSDRRRAAGRRDLPYLRGVTSDGSVNTGGLGDVGGLDDVGDIQEPDDPGGLTPADITGNGVLLCALNVEGTEHDFRFYGWTGNDRNIALEAADAIRYMRRNLPTRILLIEEALFRPRGQADVTAALNAYTSGAFVADQVERRNGQFLWAVLTAKTNTFLTDGSGLLGFAGPGDAPYSILEAGDLQRTLPTPWQAGYNCSPAALANQHSSEAFDCVSFINTWETSPVSLDAKSAETGTL